MRLGLNNRIFVSETSLPHKIMKSWDSDTNDFYIANESLSISECEALVKSLKINIVQEAKKILKYIRGNIEGIDVDIMYVNMEDKCWRQAALIVEIFRIPAISKNAGNLNTKELQKKLYNSLKSGRVDFLIGWGQAKRYCGGLKTEGYSSDFSELYSIVTLYIIMRSIHIVCQKEIILNVLTGGTRFYPALFTDPEKTNEYDIQRQAMADIFSTEFINMKFIAYHDSIDNDNSKLNDLCQLIEPAEIEKTFKTVLMNVDWHAILTNLKIAPHGINIPPSIDKYIKSGGNVSSIIRMAIVSILNRKAHSYWIEKIGDSDLFDETIDFFNEVSRESTKKYLAIHLMDTDIDTTEQSKLHSGAIRLTVHEKKDRRDIPAILTLGIKGGNNLSQHVVTFLSPEGILFETMFGILGKENNFDKKIRRVMAPEHGFLSWLNHGEQPLFYSNIKKEQYLEALFKLKFIEN